MPKKPSPLMIVERKKEICKKKGSRVYRTLLQYAPSPELRAVLNALQMGLNTSNLPFWRVWLRCQSKLDDELSSLGSFKLETNSKASKINTIRKLAEMDPKSADYQRVLEASFEEKERREVYMFVRNSFQYDREDEYDGFNPNNLPNYYIGSVCEDMMWHLFRYGDKDSPLMSALEMLFPGLREEMRLSEYWQYRMALDSGRWVLMPSRPVRPPIRPLYS